MILGSNLFFDASVRRRRVKCPVEFAVGTLRSLEVLKPTVAPAAVARACVQMGQGLFAPPSVAGWDWGQAWINSTTLLARANYILALLSDDDDTMGHRCDPAGVAARHGFHRPVEAAKFLLDLLIAGPLDPSVKDPIQKAVAAQSADPARAVRDAARRILNLPEYQLA
jgi:hypothetical protein